MAGLTCARILHGRGVDVRVIDKARGVGGRMSTRQEGELRFDHGAPCFTAHDAGFRAEVEDWTRRSIAARWNARFRVLDQGQVREFEELERIPHYVGIPTMSAICRGIAEGIEVVAGTRIESLERNGRAWDLRAPEGNAFRELDAVVISAPAPQAAGLLAPAPGLADRARSVATSACWALMVSLEDPLDLPFDAAFVHDSPLAWAGRNSSKPGREARHECWVLHASQAWSGEHRDLAEVEAREALLEAFRAAIGRDRLDATFATAHRWLHAIAPAPLGEPFLLDAEARLGACGDWCTGPGVEGAFLSGRALAERLLEIL